MNNPRMLEIRWLIRRDIPEILDIEKCSFEFPWSEEDIMCCLRQRNCIGMVAVHDDRVVGYMIYELHKSKLHILNFAVRPDMRRQQVGWQMVQRLIDKIAAQRRDEVVVDIRERNLAAQLFFKACGFVFNEIRRGCYDDTDEDMYTLSYRLIREPGTSQLQKSGK